MNEQPSPRRPARVTDVSHRRQALEKTRSRPARVLLFFARIPVLVLALVSIGIALWVFSELIGDSRMVETMGVVTESESVLPGTSISPPELSDMPCRYPSGSGFWSAFSSGWFIAEHDAGAVLFCSGHRDVGTEVAMWVSPGDPSNGRLVAPTFTIGQAILWLVAVLLIAGGLGWAWVKMH